MNLNIEVVSSRAAEIFADPSSAALFAENERECANPLLGPVKPLLEVYEALEASGAARFLAARIDGKLCGFACVLIAVAPHYGELCATVESLFVSKDKRTWGVGALLLEVVQELAERAGCMALFYTAPMGSALARILRFRSVNVVQTNEVFTQRLR